MTENYEQEFAEFGEATTKYLWSRDRVAILLGCLLACLISLALAAIVGILSRFVDGDEQLLIAAIILTGSVLAGSILAFAQMLFVRIGILSGFVVTKKFRDMINRVVEEAMKEKEEEA